MICSSLYLFLSIFASFCYVLLTGDSKCKCSGFRGERQAYLSAFLKLEGYKVHFIDSIAEGLSKSSLIRQIVELKPDIIGLTAPTQQIIDAAAIAHEVKNVLPETKTVIGGYHASALPAQTLEEFGDFDYLVYGEGEISLLELLKAIPYHNNAILKDIKGIAFREGDGIIVNPQRPHISISIRYRSLILTNLI